MPIFLICSAGVGVGYKTMPAPIGPLTTGPPAVGLIRPFRAELAAAYGTYGSTGPEPLTGADPLLQCGDAGRSDEDLPFDLG